jgi:hypothetical protein
VGGSVPASWFQQNLHDPAVAAVAYADYSWDGSFTRNGLLDVFARVEANGTVSVADLHDLQTLIANAGLLQMPDYVAYLGGKVTNADPANANYQSLVAGDLGATVRVTPLGNLRVGSPAWQLRELVNKWFLGVDYPTTVPVRGGGSGGLGTPYYVPYYVRVTAGSLFGGQALYTDVQQGQVGDCFFLAAVADVARASPQYVSNMFIDNGDGTYTVRFYDNGPEYVTVDRWLPAVGGDFSYADYKQSVWDNHIKLWVPLLERAYVQYRGETYPPAGYDTFNAGGRPERAMSDLTGLDAWGGELFTDQDAFTQAVTGGELVCLDTHRDGTVGGYTLVAPHAYSVLGYDAATHLFTIYNPWGYEVDLQALSPAAYAATIAANSPPGQDHVSVLLRLNWAQITQAFSAWDESDGHLPFVIIVRPTPPLGQAPAARGGADDVPHPPPDWAGLTVTAGTGTNTYTSADTRANGALGGGLTTPNTGGGNDLVYAQTTSEALAGNGGAMLPAEAAVPLSPGRQRRLADALFAWPEELLPPEPAG